MSKSVIEKMLGDVDGVNNTFTTPTTYVAGTYRLVLNGQVYEPDDTRHGWAEIDSSTIETIFTPRVGDELQGFYVDSTGGSADNVTGSPFDPNNIYP